MHKNWLRLFLVSLSLWGSALSAQETPPPAPSPQETPTEASSQELPPDVKARLDRLEKEVEALRSERPALPSEPLPGESGSPASSLTFHGYGELHYNHPVVKESGFPSDDLNPTLDFHRLVLGWSWRYDDHLSVHAEIDFEHAAQEIELEFAYIEYQYTDLINFRAGSLLLPVGPLNEFHEPPLFYSVERPYTEQYIIPTSWNAGGFGLFGQIIPGLKYRLYLIEGLDAAAFTREGIMGGRQNLFEDTNRAFNFGGVARVEYVGLPGLSVGGSLYSAGAAQGDGTIGRARVSLGEADVRYRLRGFDLAALYALTHITNSDRISARVGETVGSEQFGGYLEGAYHLSSLVEGTIDLVPFIRWERINTQARVASDLSRDPTANRSIVTYGLAYYPHPDVALKVDREMWRNDANQKARRTNLGVAFMF